MNFQMTCKNIVHRRILILTVLVSLHPCIHESNKFNVKKISSNPYKSKSYLPPEQKKSNYTTNINISDLITGCPTSNLFYIFQIAITQKLCDLDPFW